MTVANIIIHSSLKGPHEVVTFAGRPEQTALTAGQEDAYLGPFVRWRPVGGTAENDEWRDAAGQRRLLRGELFVRPLRLTSEEDGEPTASWRYWRASWEGAEDTVRMRLVPSITVAAGLPMRTPVGEPIIFADGTRPLQPASGEPARDQWTGQLTGGVQP